MEAFALAAAQHLRPSLTRSGSSAAVEPPRIPNGACNFRDGAQSTCGCRHFWLNDALKPGGDSDARVSAGAWCFCGHHACFHALDEAAHIPRDTESVRELDGYTSGTPIAQSSTRARHDPTQSQRSPAAATARLAGCEEPRLVHSASSLVHPRPLSRDQYPSSHTAGPPFGKPQPHKRLYSSFNGHSTRSPVSSVSGAHTQNGLTPYGRWEPAAERIWRDTSMPGSMAGNREIRIGSQRTILGRAENEPTPQRYLQGSPRHSFSRTIENAAMSPTEVATTPSNAGTPAARGSQDANDLLKSPKTVIKPSRRVKSQHTQTASQNTCASSHSNTRMPDNERSSHSSTTIEYILSQIAALKSVLPADPNLNATLSALRHRLDALECVSYSRGPDDELQDMVELLEGRMIDTEEKVEDLERIRISHIRSSASPSLNAASFRDSGSFLTAPLANISHEAASSRIEEFEQRLQVLESAAPPTTANPWEIEVVMLPWGRSLKGIWFSPDADIETPNASGKVNTIPATSCAAMHNNRASSLPTKDFHGQALKDWGGSSSDWLAPRACGPTRGSGGKVYERLRSRGFVRCVNLHHNAAREVRKEITACFADVLDTLLRNESHLATSSTYLGLQAPFVPLRKVHKSSRLRFLSAAELTTPSLWTGEFLNSSIFMKAPSAGVRRLFITQAAAYHQYPLSSTHHEWSWPRIRALSQVISLSSDDDMESEYGVEVDELCWHPDQRLDVPISTLSSFTAVDSGPEGSFASLALPSSDQEMQESSSDAEHDDIVSDASSMDQVYLTTTPTSLYSARQFRRTVSDPMTAQEVDQLITVQTISKRQTLQSQPAAERTTVSVPKRRRLSQIPATKNAGFTLPAQRTPTPCLSHEPSSPLLRTPNVHTQNIGNHRSGHPGLGTGAPPVSVKRSASQSAYATPYSNNAAFNGINMEHVQPGGGDTDMDSDDDLAGFSTQVAAKQRKPDLLRHRHGDHPSSDAEVWDGVADEARRQMQESDQDDDEEDDDDEDSHEDEEIFEEWARKADDDYDDDDEDMEEDTYE